MTFDHTQITKSLVSVVLFAAAALAGGCSTDAGTKKAGSADPAQETEYLSAAEVRKDPDRVICRRHCMTARQWQQASDDTARTLDRAQRTTGGTDGQ